MQVSHLEYDPSSPDVMMQFYKRLFPYRPFFHWLNHDHTPSKLFTYREFAFTLAGDVYLRYNSFANIEDFARELRRLNPSRFEVGAIYNARPRDKRTLRAGALQPQMRELVFDIDMTDYDAIRTCCSGKGICKRCWAFIAAAVTVLDSALRNQFDYHHLLWVYSGRRGIHCWVSDKSALSLTDDQRKALVGYLEVIKGGAEMVKKVNVRLGVQELGGYFSQVILEDQKCFDTEEGQETLLSLVPDKTIVGKLRKLWAASPDRTSSQKFKDLNAEISQIGDRKQAQALKQAQEDIMLQYLYPRIDAEVSKHRNHLLKAPFCIHPATGRVCVPVDPEKVDKFDPEAVPTVGGLLYELNLSQQPKAEAGADPLRGDWDRTSLKPYVQMLEKHSQALIRATREERQKRMKVEGMSDW
ncbi:prim-pol domain-containing protein [Dacryopinax primogenitus]|uniref:DNA primase n=1 Tax=Dacryopinax primogenitus (strain DJM 731) TaxID=1858805 RepID=M5G1M1_DACPD|nr:prim-pol domain-containing protein [Dacryopinax primogenitus]EJU02110.1 prim-pol domain-containing protein [Dacryopinax primogenitus]